MRFRENNTNRSSPYTAFHRTKPSSSPPSPLPLSSPPLPAAAMSFVPVNPRPMLQDLVGKPVSVRLKWGETEYKGALVSIDSYMNLQLSDTEEFIDGESTGQLGQVLIRYVGRGCYVSLSSVLDG